MHKCVLFVSILVLSGCSLRDETASTDTCQVSQFSDQVPQGAEGNIRTLPASWLCNEDGTLCVANLDIYNGNWYAGSEGMKVHWWRSEGSFTDEPLSIEGMLLGNSSIQLIDDIPCCYGNDQVVSVEFPTEGCWQLYANSGDFALDFVAQVASEQLHPLSAP